jgi:hypothetical protein
MAKNLFNKYIWLVDTIYRSGKITLKEINEKWVRNEMSEGKEIPRKTFSNQRIEIESLFDINIECDRQNGNVYYIENREEIEKSGVRSWLLNTFAVNNLINESHRLKRRILFEEIPSGRKFLTPIIEAMRDSLRLEITYQSFWHDEPNTFEIEPYCVKVFKQRWYVVARSPYYDTIRIYSLDRIEDLRTTDTGFKLPKKFDPEAYFNESFGIFVDETIKPEAVEIKVYGNERKFLRALPLHHSQEESGITEDWSVFRYFVSPTHDFKQELLSHGAEMEVLSPAWFRDEISNIVKEMGKAYSFQG